MNKKDQQKIVILTELYLEQYSESQLKIMLLGELERISKSKASTLSGSEDPEKLVEKLKRLIIEFLYTHPITSITALKEYLIDTVFDFVVEKQLIEAENISRDNVMIALFVALLWDFAVKKWRKEQSNNNDN